MGLLERIWPLFKERPNTLNMMIDCTYPKPHGPDSPIPGHQARRLPSKRPQQGALLLLCWWLVLKGDYWLWGLGPASLRVTMCLSILRPLTNWMSGRLHKPRNCVPDKSEVMLLVWKLAQLEDCTALTTLISIESPKRCVQTDTHVALTSLDIESGHWSLKRFALNVNIELSNIKGLSILKCI